MISLLKLLPLALGLFLGCFFTSWFNAGELAIARGDLVTLKAMHSEQMAQTAIAALHRMALSNTRAARLQTELTNTEQRLTQFKRENQREINHATTGSACLNPATVRLLNNTNERDQAASLPTPASGFIEADGAVATDLDVASWINDAKAQYNICRSRLDALIDWHAPSTSLENTHD